MVLPLAKSNQMPEGQRGWVMHSTKVSLLGSRAGQGSVDKSWGVACGEYLAHEDYKRDEGRKNV